MYGMIVKTQLFDLVLSVSLFYKLRYEYEAYLARSCLPPPSGQQLVTHSRQQH